MRVGRGVPTPTSRLISAKKYQYEQKKVKWLNRSSKGGGEI